MLNLPSPSSYALGFSGLSSSEYIMAPSQSGNAVFPILISRSTSTQSDLSTKQPQKRVALSCTHCRERKVKVLTPHSRPKEQSIADKEAQCDRTKPCSACCASGHPRKCVFEADRTGDYGPISQSYEIRELRRENQRLKEELCDVRAEQPGESDENVGARGKPRVRVPSRAAAARKKKLRYNEWSHNIYFGTPAVGNVIADVCIPLTLLKSWLFADLSNSSPPCDPKATPLRILSLKQRASTRRTTQHIRSP
jgi:hypothetical protein